MLLLSAVHNEAQVAAFPASTSMTIPVSHPVLAVAAPDGDASGLLPYHHCRLRTKITPIAAREAACNARS
jgi:hypothetical protein